VLLREPTVTSPRQTGSAVPGGVGLAVQPDGRLVVAGVPLQSAAGRPSFLARVNFNGTPDVTFGTRGVVTLNPSQLSGTQVVVHPDGRILVAGRATANGGDFVVARYNPDGTADATFGTGGVTATDFAGRDDAATALLLQRDGRTVAAGTAQNAQGQNVFGV